MSQHKDKIINIDLNEVHYKLIRLSDGQYHDFWRNSISIADDYRFYLDFFYRYLERRGECLNLAQIYCTLTELCGESNKFIDNYKGSFSFPFLLEVKKSGKQFNYLLTIFDFRGSIEFGFRKLLQPQDTYDKRFLYQPFTEGFSREEINNLIVYMYSYVKGVFEDISKDYQKPFFKKVISNTILYGYKDGNFFEEQYNSSDDFENAVKLLENQTSVS